MSQNDDGMSGVLFKNEEMREGKGDPHYRGNANVAGRRYWISAWLNTSRDGQRYLKLRFREKEAPKKEQPAAPGAMVEDFNDEIPF